MQHIKNIHTFLRGCLCMVSFLICITVSATTINQDLPGEENLEITHKEATSIVSLQTASSPNSSNISKERFDLSSENCFTGQASSHNKYFHLPKHGSFLFLHMLKLF